MRKVIFSIAFANVFLGAMAQSDSVKTQTLDEVVVTATKFAKNISETGKVLTVIDEEQIKRSVGKDLSQLLNEQAGLTVNGSNSNPGKDKSVYLRGAANKYTLVLLDGVPLNDPSGIDGGAYDLRMIPLNQIERIEILKGSQSTLYGSDAIAGVINIITKRGGDKSISGSGTLSYGSFNTKKAVATVAGQTSIFDYNVGYSHLDSDGFSEAKDQTGNGNFDKDGVTQNSLQANLGITPSKSLSIKPFFRYNTFISNYDDGSFQDSKVDHSKSELINTGMSGKYKLQSGSINALYGYTNSARTYTSAYGVGDYKGKFQNAEVFWNHNLSSHIQLLAGVNYQHWKMFDNNATEKNPSTTISSPYASFFIKNLNGLSVELGARHNIHSKYGNNFTWSFNPSYWVTKKVKLFFNYSTGFKAPSLNQLYGQYGPNPDLKPEKSETYEGGAQLVLNNKIDIRAVVFARNIKDVIIYNSSYQYVNFNQQNDYGLEIEPSFYVTSNLTIKAFYAFVDGKAKTKTPTGNDTTYNNLIRRPKNTLGASISYRASDKLFFSAGLKTFGKRDDQYYDASFLFQKVVLSPYQLLDIYAEYKVLDGKLNFFVNFKNILNQDYQEVAGYNTMKFNATGGVTARF